VHLTGRETPKVHAITRARNQMIDRHIVPYIRHKRLNNAINKTESSENTDTYLLHQVLNHLGQVDESPDMS
jgi:hypothetical protein